jgi:hypothetical protein
MAIIDDQLCGWRTSRSPPALGQRRRAAAHRNSDVADLSGLARLFPKNNNKTNGTMPRRWPLQAILSSRS